MIRNRFKVLIAVKAAKRAAANTFFTEKINNRQGGETFTQGINASGTGTPTWYWSSMILEKWQLAKLVEIADANSSDVRIVIWAHQKGIKQDIIDKMNNRAYITIADGAQNPKDFLTAFNMKVVSS